MCAYHFWLDIKNNHKQKPSYKIDIQLDSKSKEFEFNKANTKKSLSKLTNEKRTSCLIITTFTNDTNQADEVKYFQVTF